MSNFFYGLEKYKNPASNITCTGCGQKKLRPYINNATGERLGNHVGRCERSDECQYHFTPKQYFEQNPESKPSDFQRFVPVEAPPRQPTFIDTKLFQSTLGFRESNTLHRWLVNLFGKATALYLIERFNIGTTSEGYSIMWRIDIHGNILSSEIIEYVAKKSDTTFTKTDCKRTKKFDWVHTHKDFNFKKLLPDFNLTHSCFGEQFINEGKPIYLVESAKTVLLCSIFLPQFTFISCGSMGNFSTSFKFLNSLRDRDIFLMPDCGKGFIEWTEKSQLKEMKDFFKSITIDNRLNSFSKELKDGADIGDWLIQYEAPAFIFPTVELIEPAIEALPAVEENIKISMGILSQPEVEEKPFWEDVPQISDVDFKRNCEVLDFWNKQLNLYDDNSFMAVDGVLIPDIKSVIIKHVKVIHEDNSSAVLSLKFLEKIKKSIT